MKHNFEKLTVILIILILIYSVINTSIRYLLYDLLRLLYNQNKTGVVNDIVFSLPLYLLYLVIPLIAILGVAKKQHWSKLLIIVFFVLSAIHSLFIFKFPHLLPGGNTSVGSQDSFECLESTIAYTKLPYTKTRGEISLYISITNQCATEKSFSVVGVNAYNPNNLDNAVDTYTIPTQNLDLLPYDTYEIETKIIVPENEYQMAYQYQLSINQ